MFHQRPRFPSRLGAEKEGRSTCSSRPSVLTRPTPRDLGCQHALRCSIHRRCMRSAPANPFPGARTTDRRSCETDIRADAAWCPLVSYVGNPGNVSVAAGHLVPAAHDAQSPRQASCPRTTRAQNADYRRLCPSSHQPRLAAPQPPTNRMNRRTTMKPIRMLLPSV
jgi:hypothetical protein